MPLRDVALDEATSMYRLLRLRPIRREDSPDGPGSLAWVWLVVAVLSMAVVAAARFRARRPG